MNGASLLPSRHHWNLSGGAVLLIIVWVCLALGFAGLAIQARGDMQTQLPRAGFRVQLIPRLQTGAVRFQDAINILADRYDDTAARMESALRRSARLRFWTSLMAAFWCGAGLCFALFQARVRLEPDGDVPILRSNPPPQRPWRSRRETFASAVYDGSFPDGGYGG